MNWNGKAMEILVQRLMAPLERARPKEALRYSINHIWFGRFEDDGHCCIGIDELVAILLSHLHEIIFPVKGHHVPRGGPIVWLDQPTGMVALPSPLPMTVHEINPMVREVPNLALTDPYGNGWLVEVEASRKAAATSLLSEKDVIENWQATVATIDKSLQRTLAERSNESIGETLPDGGRFITSISQLLSSAEYINLLQEVLKVSE